MSAMEEDRVKKIEKGREKLEAYKKRKQKRDKRTDENSDSSLSFSSLELPDNANRPEISSGSSTISEHLDSFRSGSENDRSLSEIDLELDRRDLFENLDDYDRISQENKPGSLSLSGKNDGDEAANDVQVILDDILNDKQFFSSSDRTKIEKSDSSSTKDVSLNIFEGVSLDDSSINNYVNKLRQLSTDGSEKVKELEKELSRKNSELANLGAELEELKSASSLNTTTTEYRGYHDDLLNRIADFQNAVAHRDTLIQQLMESLQQSNSNREELEQKSENFAKEIALLQKQLIETSNVIKQHKCFNSEQWSPVRKNFAKARSKDSLSSVDAVDFAQGDAQGVVEQIAQEKIEMSVDKVWTRLEDVLSPQQLSVLNELKSSVNLYVQQKVAETRDIHQQDMKLLQDKQEAERSNSTEIAELRQELEVRHAKEMEELRTYFEKKCADVEKNYSEEIFSQQSRKMSGSSTGSEQELLHDSQCPGPGGDADVRSKITTPKRSLKDLSKDDLLRIKVEMTDFCKRLETYTCGNISNETLNQFKEDFHSSNLITFCKFKFCDLQNEIRNKYNAELEILREDYENKIDERNVEYETNIETIKSKHQEELDALRYELDQALRSVHNHTAIQEVGSSGDFEIAEVVESYERRLQEQVALARLDIITILERQIQMLAQNSEDRDWPPELLQIKRRFCERYEAEIEELKESHREEVRQLKDEHFKVLNGALERARRRSLKENEGFTETEMEILKDRDSLRKSNTILRNLVNELLKYFTRCEDELNKTLIDEMLRYGFDGKLTRAEGEDLDMDATDSTLAESFAKRVHFTPKLNLTAIDLSLDPNVSVDFKNELTSCLDRLKSDANAILALTSNVRNGPEKTIDADLTLEEKIGSLTHQMISTAQINDDLERQLEEAKEYARGLESERVSLENHVEQLVARQKVLEKDLSASGKKIAELIECGHKEIVSEGYGQNNRTSSLGGKIACLAELQEKARHLVTEWKNGADHPLIQLVEELCREGERITDEAKKDREDLRQQIEAADKKLRATCQFLEEQAMEREQERDDAQREIEELREQLREKEKERQTRDLVAREVEHLESQMREMTKAIDLGEVRQQEAETERNEAIDKIHVLREIIRDLEAQLENKTVSESELQEFVSKLEPVVKQQSGTIQELSEQLEAYKSGPDVDELKQRIVYLEKEAQKLRLNNELAGSEGVVKEIQVQLHEFETSIDKKTRALEGLHSALSTTECSTPSEEMSYRDHVRPNTPSSALDECDVPLQQLARLKEKLIKHSRAEDAAVKRIRDLEMQLTSIKQELEDAQNEKDILQNQVTEQIVLLSSLQMRLDEQRLKAEQNQKQANTSLELKIYDLENEVQSLKDTMHAKDKNIKQLNKIIDETKKRLEDRERELNSQDDDEILVNFEKEINRLKEENCYLKTKIDSDAQSAQILPGLVDNIIADKNSDIEKLRLKLDDTQRQLESFLSLNLDYDQLRQISQLKSSERGFSDFLNLTDVGPMRRAESRVESVESSMNFLPKQLNETKRIFNDTPEITKIDSRLVQNSTEIPKVSEKKVHFEDIESLDIEINKLKNDIILKDQILNEYSEKIKDVHNLEENMEKLRRNLEVAEDNLNRAAGNFDKEEKDFKEIERGLRLELAEKKMKLSEAEKELELSVEDHKRKDQMYMSLAKEKRDIEANLKNFEDKNFEVIIQEKNDEIFRLEDQLSKLLESCVALEEAEVMLTRKDKELGELKEKIEMLQNNFKEKSKSLEDLQKEFNHQADENEKLLKEINNQTQQIRNLTKNLGELQNELAIKNIEIAKLQETISSEQNSISAKTDDEIQKLKDLVVDKDCEIEILNEDIVRYQNELQSVKELHNITHQKEISERNIEIIKLKSIHEELNKEIAHLQDYLREKDNVIEQMQHDTKSLHVNLETIQNKIQETGNIVDLRKRLQEEKHLNAVLTEEVRSLKSLEFKEKCSSIEDIRGEVQKQLEYSAHLDSNIIQALSSGDEEKETKEIFERSQLKLDIQQLEMKLEKEKENVARLSSLLDKERHVCTSLQIEDSNLIEQLRIQLEAALDARSETERQLENEEKLRFELENEIKRLKCDLSSSSKTEVTEYKKLPSAESQELYKLKEEVGSLVDANKELRTEIKGLRKTKSEQTTNLKYVKDMLSLKMNELEKLETKFDDFRTNEMELKEKLIVCTSELDQKIREVENSRILLGELEQERLELKKEHIILNDRLRELEEEKRLNEVLYRERESNLNSTVPEKLVNKMRELTIDTKKQMEENKVLTNNLTKMAIERSKLLDKIRKLECANCEQLVFNEPSSRVNHLFGKYLRSESYRKALIWQKEYLIKLLISYQEIEPNMKNLFDPKYPKRQPVRKFRAYATMVIAISRMKYMVQRWHTGVRNYAYNSPREATLKGHGDERESVETRFEVGQPVSSQNFYSSVHSNDLRHVRSPMLGRQFRSGQQMTATVDRGAVSSFSGNSPPQKERLTNTLSNFTPLQTPHLLTEYVQRFDEMQQRLGLTVEKMNS